MSWIFLLYIRIHQVLDFFLFPLPIVEFIALCIGSTSFPKPIPWTHAFLMQCALAPGNCLMPRFAIY